jgi:hypothetical protein
MRLADFTSPHITDVWRFFEGLRYQEEAFKASPELPEPKTSIAAECRAYVAKICGNRLSGPAKDAMEVEFVGAMRAKYPHLKWGYGRKANLGR